LQDCDRVFGIAGRLILQRDHSSGARQKPHIHAMLAELEGLQAVDQRVLVTREQSARRGAIE